MACPHRPSQHLSPCSYTLALSSSSCPIQGQALRLLFSTLKSAMHFSINYFPWQRSFSNRGWKQPMSNEYKDRHLKGNLIMWSLINKAIADSAPGPRTFPATDVWPGLHQKCEIDPCGVGLKSSEKAHSMGAKTGSSDPTQNLGTETVSTALMGAEGGAQMSLELISLPV